MPLTKWFKCNFEIKMHNENPVRKILNKVDAVLISSVSVKAAPPFSQQSCLSPINGNIQQKHQERMLELKENSNGQCLQCCTLPQWSHRFLWTWLSPSACQECLLPAPQPDTHRCREVRGKISSGSSQMSSWEIKLLCKMMQHIQGSIFMIIIKSAHKQLSMIPKHTPFGRNEKNAIS